MSDPLLLMMTCANRNEAETIARTLVDESLAACCTIVGDVTSVYRWEGAVERAEEVMVIIKTVAARYDELERRVHELHSYDTPELIALPITTGSRKYLAWLGASTGVLS